MIKTKKTFEVADIRRVQGDVLREVKGGLIKGSTGGGGGGTTGIKGIY